jgi:hypothetical protein
VDAPIVTLAGRIGASIDVNVFVNAVPIFNPFITPVPPVPPVLVISPLLAMFIALI